MTGVELWSVDQLVTGEFGDGLLSAVVDQRLAGSSGGDERGDGGIVELRRASALSPQSTATGSAISPR